MKAKAVLLTVLAMSTAVMLAAGPAWAKQGAKVSEQEAAQIGVEAYIYGYPLVTMEMTRRVLTNVAAPEAQKAPVGQFARLREYPTPANKEVTAPNADTLYTLAWLDVSKEPWVLSLPDMQDRYFLMPMLSGWTDVFQVPGTADHRHQGPDLCHHRPQLEGDAASRRHGIQIPHRHGMDFGPHLLHRHPGGLQGGARLAGPV